MFHDVPESDPLEETMLAIDLDKLEGLDPTNEQALRTFLGGNGDALGETHRVPVLTWGSPAHFYRELTPPFSRLLAKGKDDRSEADIQAGKEAKPSAMAGWQRFIVALEEVVACVQDDLFQRAAQKVQTHQKVLLALLTLIQGAEKARAQASRKEKTEPNPPILNRVFFRLDGKSLHTQDSYKEYRKQEYDGIREGRTITCPVTGDTIFALITAPGSLMGGKPGSNVSKKDSCAQSWGWEQNTRMRIEDTTFLNKLAALQDGTVPMRGFKTSAQEVSHLLLWDVAPVVDKDTCEYPAEVKRIEGYTLNEQQRVWINQLLDAAIKGSPLPKIDEGLIRESRDLRLAIIKIADKVRIRVSQYEALSSRDAFLGVERFHRYYCKPVKEGKPITAFSLWFILQSLNHPTTPDQDTPSVAQHDFVDWTHRIMKGEPVSLNLAVQAVRRNLKDRQRAKQFESHPGILIGRSRCHQSIVEDFMSTQGTQDPTQNPFYLLGQGVWKAANLAYTTGSYSNRAKTDAQYAQERQDRFIDRYLPLACSSPMLAITSMLSKVQTYIKAVPSRKAAALHKANATLQLSLTSMVDQIGGTRTPLDQVMIWKGYADARQAYFNKMTPRHQLVPHPHGCPSKQR